MRPAMPTKETTYTADTFGKFTVHKWGTAWVVMRDRADGVRIVCTLPWRSRREAREWAAHLDAKEKSNG